MARQRLTKKLVQELPAPEKGQAFLWDSEVPGFGVRSTPTGAKSYIVQFRVRGGKERRMVIGRCDRVPLDQGRLEARKVLAAADLGRDPAEERREARTVQPDMNPLFADFAEKWLSEVAEKRNRASTLKFRRLLLTNHILSAIGRKRLSEIHRRDIEEMHRRVSERHAVTANRCVSLCSTILAAAVRWGHLEANPALQIERNPEHHRERYLTPQEIKRLQVALNEHPSQGNADVIRLLMLTGARSGEVFRMRWDQVDLDADVWTKPAATTKQNRLHRIPLSPPAVNLLRRRQEKSRSEWVFPSGKTKGHITTIRHFWGDVCEAAGIEGVRIHDLRHTFASLLVSSGESLPVIGALLGHTQAKTTSRYAHLLDDPLRAATERISTIIRE